MEKEREEWRICHFLARKPEEEVDVDDVVGMHQHIRLLLGAELEVVHAEEHLQDVESSPHPSCMVSGAETFGHFENWLLSTQKL